MPSSSGMSGKTAAPSGTSEQGCSGWSAMSASCDRGDDGQDVAVLGRGLQVVEIADVFIVEIDVDEATHLAVLEDSAHDVRELDAQCVEHLLDGGAGQIDRRLAVGVLPHRLRDLNFHWHEGSLSFR